MFHGQNDEIYLYCERTLILHLWWCFIQLSVHMSWAENTSIIFYWLQTSVCITWQISVTFLYVCLIHLHLSMYILLTSLCIFYLLNDHRYLLIFFGISGIESCMGFWYPEPQKHKILFYRRNYICFNTMCSNKYHILPISLSMGKINPRERLIRNS